MKFLRTLGWLLVIVGVLLLVGFGSIELVKEIWQDAEIPVLVKVGMLALIGGIVVLILALIKERREDIKKEHFDI